MTVIGQFFTLIASSVLLLLIVDHALKQLPHIVYAALRFCICHELKSAFAAISIVTSER